MAHQFRTKLLLAILLLLTWGPGYCFSSLVVFGDSLSDTGNLAVGFQLPPPYYNNRISDGPLAVDIVASDLMLSASPARQFSGNTGGTNYAVAGANASGGEAEDLAAQLSAFQRRYPQGLGADALYLIFVGGNDVRAARDIIGASERNARLERAVSEIQTAVITLVSLGATNLVVVNAPNIARAPETLETNNPALIARAAQSSRAFNEKLEREVQKLRNSRSAKFMLFDLYNSLEDIVSRPARYGFSVVDRPCYDSDRLRLNAGCNFTEFVFFDAIHLTGRSNEIIGRALTSDIRRELGGDNFSAALGGILQLLTE